MEMTNKQILERLSAITQLSKHRLPVPIALSLAKLTREMRKHEEAYRETMRNALLAEGFTPAPDGSMQPPEKISPEKISELNTYMEELLNAEVEMETDVKKIPLSTIAQHVKEIEPEVLEPLIGWLIDEDP